MKLLTILSSRLSALMAVFAFTAVMTISMTEAATIDSLTPIDQVKAASTNGNADAMFEYGDRLVHGRGVDTNTTEGLQWLQKAADAGKNLAWYDLGFVYANGVGVKENIVKAVPYWRKGAEAGNAECQTSMGMLYQAGDKFPSGLKADPVEAIKWYRLAADQNTGEAIQHLAMIYWMGQGVEADAGEAVKWFRKGAELGDGDCIWGLGKCYLSGNGVKPDTIMAYALFSASLGGVENPEQRKAMSASRDELGKALTADQVKKADPLIQEWKGKGNK